MSLLTRLPSSLRHGKCFAVDCCNGLCKNKDVRNGWGIEEESVKGGCKNDFRVEQGGKNWLK